MASAYFKFFASDKKSITGKSRDAEHKETIMKKLVALLLLTAMSQLTIACNTVEGAGQDIQSGGEAIEDAAN